MQTRRKQIGRGHAEVERTASWLDWRKVAIGDIADIIGGGTPSTQEANNFDGVIPWLTPRDLSGTHDRYVECGRRNLSQYGLDGSSARLLPTGSVLLTTRAPIGHVALAKNPIATNQGFRNLVARDAVSSEYLYYWLRLNTDELERHASGSTFQELPGSSLGNIRLLLPPLSQQRSIAYILGTLDDKIELNRRISVTLEAMARVLFRSWFVAFDPVRAKMEGCDTGLPREVADLFPDRLVDSELGEIPEGWTFSDLGDMIELAYGRPLKAKSRNAAGGVPVFGSSGQVGWHDEALVARPGIVVGRKGNPGTVTLSPTEFFPIDTTFYVVPREEWDECLYFLFLALQEQDLPSLAADSAVPGLNRNVVSASKQVRPPTGFVKCFNGWVSTIYARRSHVAGESRLLNGLRDTLLPKLVSGALRVKGRE